jgi:hypothetical protein
VELPYHTVEVCSTYTILTLYIYNTKIMHMRKLALYIRITLEQVTHYKLVLYTRPMNVLKYIHTL